MSITLTLTFQFLIGENVVSGEMRVNRFQESQGDQRLTYKVTEESSEESEESSCGRRKRGISVLVPRPTRFYLPRDQKKRRALGARVGDILIAELSSFVHEFLCKK